ncbi:MAG: potassium/proton antiporter [Leptolyngbya sp. PLA3]|nr:MAG: potassium/proton antiporter [Cyanobacteria bacterium CYA]MCE7969118.1 potassium/proton antiporter [Leptolyngbya sp. PL-A3]
MTLALSEPYTTAVFLTVFGLLVTSSVLLTRVSDRAGVPVVLAFLILGMLGGSQGLGGISFDNYELAFRIGTIALVLILFDGGLNTSIAAIRSSASTAGVLATVGVGATAAALAVIGRLFGLSWSEALLIGAIVSSTDAAAVFAVLRGGSLRVKQKVRSTLEVESCINDPMAFILTVVMVEMVQTGVLGSQSDPLSPPPPFGFWRLLYEVPLQLLIGALVGVGVGLLTRWVLASARVGTAGLYPVITLASALLAFGAATLASGSGFLAVFAAAVLLGNGPLPFRSGLTRVHDAIAWFCQVAMFLMLGLLVTPEQLIPAAGIGLALGLALACVARPLVVTLCMLPFRWPLKEVGYVSWVGIRGAVPIILATFPVMARVPNAEHIFHIVFFIVVVSALVPGASIVPLTRRLGLADPHLPAPAAALELHSLRQMNGEIQVYHIEPTVAACGAPLSQIPFPDGAAAIMVVRGPEVMAARGHTVFQPGDYVYIFCRPTDEAQIGLLFGDTAQM